MREDIHYALALIGEESSEIGVIVGKALRFGLDARGPDGPPYHGSNARELLPIEAGDVLAALRYAALCGILDLVDVERCADAKLAKLLDPDCYDANGNPLAPIPGRTANPVWIGE